MPLNMNRHHKTKGSKCHVKVKDTLKRLRLDIPLTMHPFEMSGGGKQKVALARAFVAEPDILLLDEPFNSLDISDRDMMRSEIVRLWEETGVTVVFVTHDLDEALLVGNQLAIIGDKPARLMSAPIPIGLPYPRTPHLLASSELMELRQRVLCLFEEGKHKLDQKVKANV
jgi:NitT/TauT family transport system ATP-binding protein